MHILLFSNGSGKDGPLSYGIKQIKGLVEESKPKKLLFIPYAVIRDSYEKREAMMNELFAPLGVKVNSIHHYKDPIQAVKEHDGFLVSGGNTWVLNRTLHENGLIPAIQASVMKQDKPYIGWSAGSNVACPTIKTTNDMPIIPDPVMPALGLVPFAINPHYLDAHIEGHKGETREDRILEFVIKNPGQTVVGLRESCLLEIKGDFKNPKISFFPESGQTLRIFENIDKIYELKAGEDLGFLYN